MCSVLAVCLSLASILASAEGVEWPAQVSAMLVGGMRIDAFRRVSI